MRLFQILTILDDQNNSHETGTPKPLIAQIYTTVLASGSLILSRSLSLNPSVSLFLKEGSSFKTTSCISNVVLSMKIWRAGNFSAQYVLNNTFLDSKKEYLNYTTD